MATEDPESVRKGLCHSCTEGIEPNDKSHAKAGRTEGEDIPQQLALSPDGNHICMLSSIERFRDGGPIEVHLPDLYDTSSSVNDGAVSSVRLRKETAHRLRDWSLDIVCLKTGEGRRVTPRGLETQVIPPLLWTRDSKGVVLRVYREAPVGKWSAAPAVYWILENVVREWTSGDVPYRQSLRRW
jgi:hypothetical protein